MQEKENKDIVELKLTDRKALVREFLNGRGVVYTSNADILVPQIQYLTHDSWEEITCLAGDIGNPLLHQTGYAGGNLFVYGNETLIVESFLPYPAVVKIVVDNRFSEVRDILSGQEFRIERVLQYQHRGLTGQKSFVEITINPHSYRVLTCRQKNAQN